MAFLGIAALGGELAGAGERYPGHIYQPRNCGPRDRLIGEVARVGLRIVRFDESPLVEPLGVRIVHRGAEEPQLAIGLLLQGWLVVKEEPACARLVFLPTSVTVQGRERSVAWRFRASLSAQQAHLALLL